MFHPRKQEVKAFVISPIHHPETAQAAICLCLGAAAAEWSSHISLDVERLRWDLLQSSTPSTELNCHCMSHEAPLATGRLTRTPQESTPYTAASGLMSLSMRPQQGKGMPALSIPQYWPYISVGCRCRGLHLERLYEAETTRWEDGQGGMPLLKKNLLEKCFLQVNCSADHMPLSP